MYCREDGTPYYIGKGKTTRIHSDRHTVGLPPKERRKFLKTCLTEEESLRHEKYMISVFGRKDIGTGILHNRTDGGESGGRGCVPSEETRKKMSAKKCGENNPNWKGGHSENYLRRTSKKTHKEPSGPWRGKHISELTPEEKEERKWEIYDKRMNTLSNL
jgi:hypothetical protein